MQYSAHQTVRCLTTSYFIEIRSVWPLIVLVPALTFISGQKLLLREDGLQVSGGGGGGGSPGVVSLHLHHAKVTVHRAGTWWPHRLFNPLVCQTEKVLF